MATTPNSDQRAILQSTNKIILIRAVAGAGKTTTLAMLAQESIVRGRNPANMIALCFSHGARYRFQEKLREEVERGSSVFVMTLEDLARKLIEDIAKKGLINLPKRYLDVDDIRGEFAAAAARFWNRNESSGNKLDFSYQLDENNQHLADLVDRMTEMKSSLLIHEFANADSETMDLSIYAELVDVPEPELGIIREYENKRHPYYDEFLWQSLNDPVCDLVFLLEARPELIGELYRWSLMLIDEWHDVNAAEFKLIRILRRNANLIVVGDEHQTINIGRGANPKFSNDYFFSTYRNDGVIELPLGTSYRFGDSIAKISRQFVENKCIGYHGKETSVIRIQYNPSDYGSCAKAVIQAILNTQSKKKIRNSDFAIILRDVDQAVEIESALMGAKIPYKCDGFETFLQLPEILMLQGILHYVSGQYETLLGDPEKSRSMVLALSRYFQVTRDPSYWEFNSEENKSVLTHAQDVIAKQPETLEHFFEGVLLKDCDFDSKITRHWKNLIRPVIHEMKNRAMTRTADEMLDYLNKTVNLQDATSRAFVNRNRATSATRSIKAFVKFAKSNGKMQTDQFLKKLWEMQNNVALNRKSKIVGKISTFQQQILVTTIQAAKGREWEYVLMPYMEKTEFIRSSGSKIDLRSYYVGITRTKSELMLFEPNDDFMRERITPSTFGR